MSSKGLIPAPSFSGTKPGTNPDERHVLSRQPDSVGARDAIEPAVGDGDAGESLSSNELPAVLTVDEVALLLRVDRKTLYALIRAGELPGVRRLGRALRVHRETMLRWLAEGQGRAPRHRRTR